MYMYYVYNTDEKRGGGGWGGSANLHVYDQSRDCNNNRAADKILLQTLCVYFGSSKSLDLFVACVTGGRGEAPTTQNSLEIAL